ncbi:NADH-ubiquinone/plastoquinone oxidoreductase chain 6 [Methanosalsum zhilinae DSM 4017]|uniref:NADH-ubiquinone/plastoquinone oxidoreductase chain 6 n=1 Tax=Methanosalsum zhilinae (strain DSM 4017 / NBRC 107636 / OCM 62 / WeN5) TaxID=679901 RepID=F7XM47_METZD|nr:NADH-quinone oxidoreductase subunit J [Methanosalsum zhilinae]AEH61433.1 NADH-ubiquinone/plastoquinone oxidoreductase chain 6 [Methanosalsum zhilinae DSM 4017]
MYVIGELIAFLIFAVALIASSIFVIAAKNIVRAGLSLIVSLFSVAGLYMLLNAYFLGVIQVLVYVGAIGILILFAIMLTKTEMGSDSDVR